MFKRQVKLPGTSQVRRIVPSKLPHSKAFSYYNSRTLREEGAGRNARLDKTTDSRHKAWWHHLPMVLAVIAIIVCIVYNLMLSTDPKTVILTDTSPTLLHSSTFYQQAARKILASSFRNYTKVTINTTSITSRLKQEFPELANVSITLPFIGQRPILYLEPATPTMILDSLSSGSFLVDANGKVLTTTPVHGFETLPVVNDQTSLIARPGQTVLATGDVAFIQLVVAELQAQRSPIQSLTLPAAARELDVVLKGQTYFIKFDLSDTTNARQQIGTFLAAKQYMASQNVTPSQYIDARIPGRVYYK